MPRNGRRSMMPPRSSRSTAITIENGRASADDRSSQTLQRTRHGSVWSHDVRRRRSGSGRSTIVNPCPPETLHDLPEQSLESTPRRSRGSQCVFHWQAGDSGRRRRCAGEERRTSTPSPSRPTVCATARSPIAGAGASRKFPSTCRPSAGDWRRVCRQP